MKIAVLVLFVGLFLVCNTVAFPVGEDVEVAGGEEDSGSLWGRLKSYISGWDVETLQNHAAKVKAKITELVADSNVQASAADLYRAAKKLAKDTYGKLSGTNAEIVEP